MGTLGRTGLEAMSEEATVDAYGEDEQRTGLFTMLGSTSICPSPPWFSAAR
ncbi:hypothetical protein [Streptomyces sp. CC228A]|uniref:hypothetical protein n=1 Tax=Streptomyces sp. CC228A TaxID=2898186 RepID=UPI001F415153|nr:hypothetical protein [Streptomyces sp. CC228A]